MLYDLLSDQKKVSLLRFIKREQDEVKNLVKRIATDSGEGAKLLERLAKEDPSIDLHDLRLPPGEAATREAIASTKKKELLGKVVPNLSSLCFLILDPGTELCFAFSQSRRRE